MSTTSQTTNPILGCIADDVTGATDLAINLVGGGMSVVQILGVPDQESLRLAAGADALVVALKTRSVPASEAVAESLEVLAGLKAIGVERFYFKYCSTFDSTEEGNIGHVADALMTALGVKQTVYCPAFPQAGRTVYQGHLFVRDMLLHESGMQHHPLNPMADANLVRFLGKQVAAPVGLLGHAQISAGQEAVKQQMAALVDREVRHVICDACTDEDLVALASGLADLPLITGGSGLARFLPAAYRDSGLTKQAEATPHLPKVAGRNLILAGSCSSATNLQVDYMSERCPSLRVDVPALMIDASKELARILEWAGEQTSETIMLSSTVNAKELEELQGEHDASVLAAAIEELFAELANRLTQESDFRRIILAGGETSGAVMKRLQIEALRIGPQICTGVPWTESIGGELELALALKSGNFGNEAFFETALEMLR